ncbi:unnamed protein product [Rhizophagus irregularis]|nr:unnamed protein product [Rhizophagus irregularis]
MITLHIYLDFRSDFLSDGRTVLDLDDIKERTNRLADGQIWIDEQMIQNFRFHFDVKSGFISSSGFI